MIIEHLSTVKSREASKQQALYCLDDQNNKNRIGLVESQCDAIFLNGTSVEKYASKFADELEKHEETSKKRQRKDSNRSAHFAVSFSDEDNLTSEEALKIAKEGMEKLFKISNRKCLIVEHGDTKNPHFHFVFAWRDNDGKALQNSNWKYKGMNIGRELEKKHKLVGAKPKPAGKNKHRKNPGKKEVLGIIKKLMNSGDFNSLYAFYEEAKRLGVNIDFSMAKTGKINGWKFEHKGIVYKASEIDRSLSWNKAQNFFIWDEEDIKHIRNNNKQDKTTNSISGETKYKTTLELAFIPKEIDGQTVYFWKNGYKAFEDLGDRITTQGNCSKAKAKAIFQLGLSKGWTEFHASGSDEFKAEIEKLAIAKGMKFFDKDAKPEEKEEIDLSVLPKRPVIEKPVEKEEQKEAPEPKRIHKTQPEPERELTELEALLILAEEKKREKFRKSYEKHRRNYKPRPKPY